LRLVTAWVEAMVAAAGTDQKGPSLTDVSRSVLCGGLEQEVSWIDALSMVAEMRDLHTGWDNCHQVRHHERSDVSIDVLLSSAQRESAVVLPGLLEHKERSEVTAHQVGQLSYVVPSHDLTVVCCLDLMEPSDVVTCCTLRRQSVVDQDRRRDSTPIHRPRSPK
jgi:hypothetical protein